MGKTEPISSSIVLLDTPKIETESVSMKPTELASNPSSVVPTNQKMSTKAVVASTNQRSLSTSVVEPINQKSLPRSVAAPTNQKSLPRSIVPPNNQKSLPTSAPISLPMSAVTLSNGKSLSTSVIRTTNQMSLSTPAIPPVSHTSSIKAIVPTINQVSASIMTAIYGKPKEGKVKLQAASCTAGITHAKGRSNLEKTTQSTYLSAENSSNQTKSSGDVKYINPGGIVYKLPPHSQQLLPKSGVKTVFVPISINQSNLNLSTMSFPPTIKMANGSQLVKVSKSALQSFLVATKSHGAATGSGAGQSIIAPKTSVAATVNVLGSNLTAKNVLPTLINIDPVPAPYPVQMNSYQSNVSLNTHVVKSVSSVPGGASVSYPTKRSKVVNNNKNILQHSPAPTKQSEPMQLTNIPPRTKDKSVQVSYNPVPVENATSVKPTAPPAPDHWTKEPFFCNLKSKMKIGNCILEAEDVVDCKNLNNINYFKIKWTTYTWAPENEIMNSDLMDFAMKYRETKQAPTQVKIAPRPTTKEHVQNQNSELSKLHFIHTNTEISSGDTISAEVVEDYPYHGSTTSFNTQAVNMVENDPSTSHVARLTTLVKGPNSREMNAHSVNTSIIDTLKASVSIIDTLKANKILAMRHSSAKQNLEKDIGIINISNTTATKGGLSTNIPAKSLFCAESLHSNATKMTDDCNITKSHALENKESVRYKQDGKKKILALVVDDSIIITKEEEKLYLKVKPVILADENAVTQSPGYKEFDFAAALAKEKEPRKPALKGSKNMKCQHCKRKLSSMSKHNGFFAKFTCPICKMRICSKTKLKKHILSHSKKLHQCCYCFKIFQTKEAYLLHKKNHGESLKYGRNKVPKEERWRCTTCKKQFKKKLSLKRHILKFCVASKEPRKSIGHGCDVCKKRFISSASLEKHTELHQILYKECQECEECFDIEEDFESHSCTGKPKIKYIYSYENTITKCLQTRNTKQKKLKNRRISSLKRSRYISKSNYCVKCVQGFKDRESFYEHVNLKECPNMKDNGQCMLCKQFFHSLENLKTHVMTCFKDSLVSLLRPSKNGKENSSRHLKKRAVFHCSRCNTLFPSIHTFRHHNQFMHPRKDKYFCNRCRFSCWSKSLLKRHLKKKECPSISSYQCFICDHNRQHYPAFGSLQTLLAHMRSHDNDIKKKERLPTLKPAKIKNEFGKTRLLSVALNDVFKLKDQKALCEVPGFGKYQLKIYGDAPNQYLSAKRFFSDISQKSAPVDVGNLDESSTTLTQNNRGENFDGKENGNKILIGDMNRSFHSALSSDLNAPSRNLSTHQEPQATKAYKVAESMPASKSIKCFSCLGVFPNKDVILSHFRSQHKWRIVQLTDCTACNIAFKDEISYKEHHKICPSTHSVEKKQENKSCNCQDCQRNLSEDPSLKKVLLSCNICKLNFGCKRQLNDHLVQMHPSPYVYVCETCETPFLTSQQLRKHYKDDHKVPSHQLQNVTMTLSLISWPCYICKKKITDVRSHAASHVVVMLECYRCNLKCSNRSLLVKHMETYHQVKWALSDEAWINAIQFTSEQEILRKMYQNWANDGTDDTKIPTDSDIQCRKCKAFFFHKATLNIHNSCNVCFGFNAPMKTNQISNLVEDEKKSKKIEDKITSKDQSNVQIQKKEPIQKKEQNERKEQSKFISECSVCSRLFQSKEQCSTHLSSVHEINNSHLPASVQIIGHFPDAHDCQICNTKYADLHSLWKHKFTHVEVRTEKCYVCQKSFAKVEELKMHTYNDHKAVFCHCCYKVFHSTEQLERHLQLHVLEVNVPRDNNGKMVIEIDANGRQKGKEKLFLDEDDSQPKFHITSKISREVLEDERLFYCYVCHKNIEGELTFIVHMKTHPESRPLSCLICQSSFDNTEALKKHVRNHFSKGSKIIPVHEESTSQKDVEEVPCKCEICSQVFDSHEEVVKHMEIMVGVKVPRKADFRKADNMSVAVKRYCDKVLCKIDNSWGIDWKIAENYHLQKIFNWKYAALSHPYISTKTNSDAYICPFCLANIIPNDKDYVSHHLKKHLHGGNLIPCAYCPSQLSPRHLIIHMESKHPKQFTANNAKCQFCLVTLHQYNIASHMAKHQQGLPVFSTQIHCVYCNVLLLKSDLVQHMVQLSRKAGFQEVVSETESSTNPLASEVELSNDSKMNDNAGKKDHNREASAIETVSEFEGPLIAKNVKRKSLRAKSSLKATMKEERITPSIGNDSNNVAKVLLYTNINSNTTKKNNRKLSKETVDTEKNKKQRRGDDDEETIVNDKPNDGVKSVEKKTRGSFMMDRLKKVVDWSMKMKADKNTKQDMPSLELDCSHTSVTDVNKVTDANKVTHVKKATGDNKATDANKINDQLDKSVDFAISQDKNVLEPAELVNKNNPDNKGTELTKVQEKRKKNNKVRQVKQVIDESIAASQGRQSEHCTKVVHLLMGGLEEPKCKICDWTFETFEYLKEHLLRHVEHPTLIIQHDSRDVCCVFCENIVRRTSMKTHLLLKHSKELEQQKREQNNNKKKQKQTKEPLNEDREKPKEEIKPREAIIKSSGTASRTATEKKQSEVINKPSGTTIVKKQTNEAINKPSGTASRTATEKKQIEIPYIQSVMPYPFNCAVCLRGYFSSGTYLVHFKNAHPWLYDQEKDKIDAEKERKRKSRMRIQELDEVLEFKKLKKSGGESQAENTVTNAGSDVIGDSTVQKAAVLELNLANKGAKDDPASEITNEPMGVDNEATKKPTEVDKNTTNEPVGVDKKAEKLVKVERYERTTGKQRKIIRPGKPPIAFKEIKVEVQVEKSKVRIEDDEENEGKLSGGEVEMEIVKFSPGELKRTGDADATTTAKKQEDIDKNHDDEGINNPKSSKAPEKDEGGANGQKTNRSESEGKDSDLRQNDINVSDEESESESVTEIEEETEEEIIESSSDNENEKDKFSDEEKDSKKNLEQRACSTSEEQFLCSHCNARFPCQTELDSHLTVHRVGQDRHFSVPYPYVCIFCGTGFYKTYMLKKHLQCKHTHNYTEDLEKSEPFMRKAPGIEQDYERDVKPVNPETTLPKRSRSKFEAMLSSFKGSKISPKKSADIHEEMELSGDLEESKEKPVASEVRRTSCRKRSITENVLNVLQSKKNKTPKKESVAPAETITNRVTTTTKENSKTKTTGTNVTDKTRSSKQELEDWEESSSSDESAKSGDETSEEEKESAEPSETESETDESDNQKSSGKSKRKYVCKYCDIVSKTHSKLKKHENRHSKGVGKKQLNKLMCVCCKTWLVRHELKWHMHKVHSNESNVTLSGDKEYCMKCNYASKKDLEEHIASSHPELLKIECRLCDVRFSTQSLYKKHFINTHGKSIDEESLECFLCNKKFLSLPKLHRHYSIIHMKKNENLCCPLCRKFFYAQTDLDKHQDEFHKNDKFQCGLCLVEFDQAELCESHVLVHKEKSEFKCLLCNFYFASSEILEKHTATHDTQVFTCNVCGNNFNNLIDYQTHKATHSERDRDVDFICALCHAVFHSESDLAEHSKKHSVQKTYQCSSCNKHFDSLNEIQQHMDKIHHGGAPGFHAGNNVADDSMETQCGSTLQTFKQCEECGETFIRPEIFLEHQRKHKKDS